RGFIRRSENGITWQNALLPSESGLADLRGVTHGNGIFIAVGDCGDIASAADGTIWSKRRSSSTCDPSALNAVAFGAGTFVAVGAGGAILQSGPIASLSLRRDVFSELTLSGPPGSYRIEYSDHLENANGWQSLSTFVVSDTASNYTDQSSVNVSQRFYRAVRD